MKKLSFLIIIVLISSCLYSESLKVAAVQLEINDYTYSSYEQFQSEMESHVSDAMRTFNPDLIIFPEYTSVFPSVTPYYEYLESSSSIEETFLKVHEYNNSIRSVYDLFIEESAKVEDLLSFWGVLAQKYSVTIIGGSYFAFDGEKLTNRLFVYGPSGDRIYEQDKYFLTDFETDIINLSSGSSANQEGFEINGKKIVLTICRDTFLERWETMYEGADLWIDIKANGVIFTEDQRDLFTRALPARMKDSTVPYGVTVCLTGQFLELLWEGESSFIKKTGDIISPIIISKNAHSNEFLYFVLE